VKTVMSLRVPYDAGKLSSGYSSSAQLHRDSIICVIYHYTHDQHKPEADVSLSFRVPPAFHGPS
jgi:hypothetical protein